MTHMENSQTMDHRKKLIKFWKVRIRLGLRKVKMQFRKKTVSAQCGPTARRSITECYQYYRAMLC